MQITTTDNGCPTCRRMLDRFGALGATPDAAVVWALCASIVHVLEDNGAENFLTINLEDKGGQAWAVTVQRPGGMTPTQKIAQLEARVAELEAALSAHTEVTSADHDD